MCGRFSFSTSREKLQKQFVDLVVEDDLQINYNIAPTQKAYVLTAEEPHHLQLYTWGLHPFWSKDSKVTGRMINSRSEGIENKPSFRSPIRRRRCLVPADSFYEWRRQGKQKIPYRILLKNGELMVMAGIWDLWRGESGEIRSFSIITTVPNKEVAQLHDRMPVILDTPEKQEEYLFAPELDTVLALLCPPPDGALEFYRVSQDVNSPRNNGPELHERVGDDQEFDF